MKTAPLARFVGWLTLFVAASAPAAAAAGTRYVYSFGEQRRDDLGDPMAQRVILKPSRLV